MSDKRYSKLKHLRFRDVVLKKTHFWGSCFPR